MNQKGIIPAYIKKEANIINHSKKHSVDLYVICAINNAKANIIGKAIIMVNAVHSIILPLILYLVWLLSSFL